MDKITKFFLFFSHDITIIPLLILGLIWLNKKISYHTICIFLISMLYAAALKLFFKISSPQYGYVFPSGHMLASTTLYGWLAYNYKNNILRVAIIIILIGIGVSLVSAGYHKIYHVVGGFGFAVLLLLCYYFVFDKTPNRLNLFNLIFANILFLYIYFETTASIATHVWLSYYALNGFILGSLLFKHSPILNIKSKVITTIIAFIGVIVINQAFKCFKLPIYLYELKWFFIGIYLPFSSFLVEQRLMNSKNV